MLRSESRKLRSGTTLAELMVTVAIAPMLTLVVGVLLVSGQRSWQRTYSSAHKQIKQDAQTVMITFGSMGRKANRLGYIIYEISGSTFDPAEPEIPGSEEVVSGDAVEFKYWDVELDEEDSYDLMDVEKIATAYALFYLEDDELKVDYGPVDAVSGVGAIPDGGGTKRTPDTTIVLAENASADPNIGAFSHTVDAAGHGQGCVRINVILTDPNDDDSIRVMTATLMRNIWPR